MATKLTTLANSVKELRIHFCQQSPASKGLREYVQNSYVSLKKSHPQLPILIREARGVEARVFGRFDKGQEKKINLENLNVSQVDSKIKELLSQ
ncbi:NADH dehydrogenase, alpha subcomplex, subunit 2 [Neoconidiobolus thromboides FSU 785]|nr:NADH dehydrogenase, alpha subcomplex, subunit 2 [Neoconidiobolus thromboides FSU 785]